MILGWLINESNLLEKYVSHFLENILINFSEPDNVQYFLLNLNKINLIVNNLLFFLKKKRILMNLNKAYKKMIKNVWI